MILLIKTIDIINTKANRDSIINDNIDSKMIFIKLLLIILKLMIKYQKLEIFRALILNRAFSSYFPSPLWNSSPSRARKWLGNSELEQSSDTSRLEVYDTLKNLGIVGEPSRYLARFYTKSIQKISKIRVSWASRAEPSRYRTPPVLCISMHYTK